MKIFKPFDLFELNFENLNIDLFLNDELSEKRILFNQAMDKIKTESKYFLKIFDQVIYAQLSKKSAIGTATIEGLFSNTDNIEMVNIEEKSTDSKNVDNDIVVNRIKNRLERMENIDLDNFINYVKEIHEEIFEDIPGYKNGKFKVKKNYIKKDGEIIIELFSPSKVESELINLSKFISFNKGKMNNVELAAIIHSYFIAIHPFKDGNGRVGRIILAEWFNSVLIHPLFLDEIFNLTKMQYVLTMNDFIITKNFKPLFNYYAQSSIDQLNRNTNLINEIIEQERYFEKILKDTKIKEKYYEGLISTLILNNLITIPKLSMELDIDRRTAKSLIDEMNNNNIINESEFHTKTKVYRINK